MSALHLTRDAMVKMPNIECAIHTLDSAIIFIAMCVSHYRSMQRCATKYAENKRDDNWHWCCGATTASTFTCNPFSRSSLWPESDTFKHHLLSGLLGWRREWALQSQLLLSMMWHRSQKIHYQENGQHEMRAHIHSIGWSQKMNMKQRHSIHTHTHTHTQPNLTPKGGRMPAGRGCGTVGHVVCSEVKPP
jgi:hypothetical protein